MTTKILGSLETKVKVKKCRYLMHVWILSMDQTSIDSFLVVCLSKYIQSDLLTLKAPRKNASENVVCKSYANNCLALLIGAVCSGSTLFAKKAS